MEIYMNLSGQLNFTEQTTHKSHLIHSSDVYRHLLSILWNRLEYTHTHDPVLWLTADAEIMRCFTELWVVIALAWCVKIKAIPCLCVIVVLDHTCYLSAWANCNQPLIDLHSHLKYLIISV